MNQPNASPSGDGMQRLHLYFSGQVQGVGFRYTALTVAQQFKITGWVRNCSEDRVEVMAEGSVKDLEDYLGKLGDEMSGYIRRVDRTWETATGEWPSFSISPSV